MLGAKLDGQFPHATREIGDKWLEVKGFRDGAKVKNIDLHICKGEIVGLAGLVGAGKTELCRALFGASSSAAGELYLNGKRLRISSPHHAVNKGLALIPEERRREGVFVDESVAVNLSIVSLPRFTRLGAWISKLKEKRAAAEMIGSLGIKTPNDQTKVKNLSGGNQQKIAIGKWLLTDADVYIFDEPTKGVDVGAKRDIYELVSELAGRGKCILYASSEMSEMIGITDRIYVMYDGGIIQELQTDQTNEEEILLYSTGGLLT
ncbi:Ribose import ATP-binding protein RbsA [compost metagenome]